MPIVIAIPLNDTKKKNHNFRLCSFCACGALLCSQLGGAAINKNTDFNSITMTCFRRADVPEGSAPMVKTLTQKVYRNVCSLVNAQDLHF